MGKLTSTHYRWPYSIAMLTSPEPRHSQPHWLTNASNDTLLRRAEEAQFEDGALCGFARATRGTDVGWH